MGGTRDRGGRGIRETGDRENTRGKENSIGREEPRGRGGREVSKTVGM